VKHLMRLHGGQVALESELGRGSRFVLEFPPQPET
jgi:signal transduction histidine kinase